MTSPIRSRVAILALGISLLAAAVGAKLVHLQVLRADDKRAQAHRQHRQTIEIDGQRGAILDREGREFAVSVTTFSLYAHPHQVKSPALAASLLSPVLGIPAARLRAQLESKDRFEWLARRLEPSVHRAVLALKDKGLPVGRGEAIDFQEEPKRFYPQGPLATQIVGFANIDQRGVEGIELKFDETLQGGPSTYLALRDGRQVNTLQLIRPATKPPTDVVLTLDLVLQHQVERELDRAMEETGAHAATAILLDPRSGEVLAMANRPAPDPARYGKAPAEARRNRAVTDVYEPGSTFKVLTAAAALEQGTISPEQRFDCRPMRIHSKAYTDVHAYGILSVREILENSSNIGAIRMALSMPRDRFREQLVGFGIGRRTGIELPGEARGSIPRLQDMSGLSVPSLAMGYEVQVTPLQIVSAIAAIANDGLLAPPRIVRGVRDQDGVFVPSPPAEPRRAVSARTAVTVANMLEGVVVRGTGKAAAVPGYHVAGKTGTARKVRNGVYTLEYYASFTAFAPLHEPRIAGIVVLDTPSGGIYYGGQTAAPALGRVFADALAYLGVPPDDDPWTTRDEALEKQRAEEAKREARRRLLEAKARRKATKSKPAAEKEAEEVASVPREIGPGDVPDLAGAGLRQAVVALTARGCRTRVEGRGRVVAQRPEPGTPIDAGTTCVLTLGAVEGGS